MTFLPAAAGADDHSAQDEGFEVVQIIDGWTVAALVVGVLGLIAGGVALLRGRARP